MALNHTPKIGEILLCDFRGYEQPEMFKSRPVIVIVRRLQGRSSNLLTVIPLSGQRSDQDFPYQVQIDLDRPLSPKFNMVRIWAKCDMIAVVSSNRLDRFRNPAERPGDRPRWLSGQVSEQDIGKIRTGILYGLAIQLDKMG